jgi:hypothetical protein
VPSSASAMRERPYSRWRVRQLRDLLAIQFDRRAAPLLQTLEAVLMR